MISVSIVEDLPEIRSSIEKLIREQPDMLLLSSSSNAEDAMPLIKEAQPEVVIMDVNMPGMSGIECISKIKDDCPGTQFMIFTIYEDDEKVFEALQAGASGYLLKNARPTEILQSLKELYYGGSPMSPNIARKLVNIFRSQSNTNIHSNVLGKRENEVLQLLSKG